MQSVLLHRLLRDALEPQGDTEATAEQILDAALGELEAHGLRRTSLERVAKRAGVNRITIYRHFAGKDELLRAVLVRQCRRFFARLFEAVDPRTRIEEAVPEIFVTALRLLKKERLFSRLTASEPELVLPLFTIRGAPLIAALREILAARLREAKRGRDAEQVAEVLARLAVSFTLLRESCVDLDDPTKARAFARACLVPLIR
jgi:AcrR family transcriptional regulator